MGQDGVGNRGNAQKVRKQDQDHDRNKEHKDEGQGMNRKECGEQGESVWWRVGQGVREMGRAVNERQDGERKAKFKK